MNVKAIMKAGRYKIGDQNVIVTPSALMMAVNTFEQRRRRLPVYIGNVIIGHVYSMKRVAELKFEIEMELNEEV